MKKEPQGATKEVATVPQAALAIFGDAEKKLNSADIALPHIGIRQNQFEKDYMKKFTPGDIILRPANLLLANEGKPVYVVPISIRQIDKIMDVSQKKPRFIRYVPYDASADWSYSEKGIQFRRDHCFIAYFLLRENLDNQAKMMERLSKGEMVDPDDVALPCQLVFSRSAYNAGKLLNTHFELSAGPLGGQTPAFITFELKSVQAKNKDGDSWFTFDIAKADKAVKYTPTDVLPVCNFWVKAMSEQQYKVQDLDEDIVDAQATVIDEARAQF